jgi:hypothetical protein
MPLQNTYVTTAINAGFEVFHRIKSAVIVGYVLFGSGSRCYSLLNTVYTLSGCGASGARCSYFKQSATNYIFNSLV